MMVCERRGNVIILGKYGFLQSIFSNEYYIVIGGSIFEPF